MMSSNRAELELTPPWRKTDTDSGALYKPYMRQDKKCRKQIFYFITACGHSLSPVTHSLTHRTSLSNTLSQSIHTRLTPVTFLGVCWWWGDGTEREKKRTRE